MPSLAARGHRLLLALAATCAYSSAVNWCEVGAMHGTARAAQPSAAENRFAERDRLWSEAAAQLTAGKLRPAIAAGEKVVAIERRLLGNAHAEVAATLAWLSRAYLEAGDFKAARRACDEALAILTKSFGANDWRTVDARWELKHLEAVQKLSAKDRAELFRGEQLNREMQELIRQRDYQRALIKMGEMLPIRQRLLPDPHRDLLASLLDASFLMDMLGDLGTAIGLADRARDVGERLYPTDTCPLGHPRLIETVAALADMLGRQGDYATALGFGERAVVLSERLYPAKDFPSGHARLAQSVDNLGFIRWKVGDLAGAIATYERALAMWRKLYPADQYPAGERDSAITLSSLGQVEESRGEYVRAREYFEKSRKMLEAIYPVEDYPEGHVDLAMIYNNLAVLLNSQGHSAEARGYYEKTLAIYERIYNAEDYPAGHPNLSGALGNLGTLLGSQDNLTEAKKYFERALAIDERLYPAEAYPAGHPSLATSLNSLGTLLEMQGDLTAARDYLERGLKMRKQLYPAEQYPQGHVELAVSLDNLGSLHEARADYAAARDYYEQALEMRERLFPAEEFPNGHPDLLYALNNLAHLLTVQGDYEASLERYERSLKMCEQLFPTEQYPKGHPILATSLSNLAKLLESGGAREAAKRLYERALAMQEQLYPEKEYPQGHSDLFTTLNNLGTLLYAEEDYVGAETYFSRTVEMCERMFPRDTYRQGHPELATSLNNLGFALRAQRKLPAAREKFEQSLAMLEALYPAEQFPAGHPALATSLDALSTMLAAEGKRNEALALALRSDQMELASLRNVSEGASEQTMRSYLIERAGSSDTLLSLAALADAQAPLNDVFGSIVQRKSALHDALLHLRELERVAAKSPDFEKDVHDRRLLLQKAADLALLPMTAERVKERDALVQQANDLEARLNRRMMEMLGADRASAGEKINFSRLHERLKRESALIEIVRYAPYDFSKGEETDHWQADRYAAFVVRGGIEKVQLFDLGPAETIDALVRELREAVASVPRELRVADEADLEEQYQEIAKRLRKALLGPLGESLAGVTRLYIGADGELTRVPFESLVDDEGRYLVESFAISYVSSAVDLVRPAAESTAGTVVFAAPDYQLEAAPKRPAPEVLAQRGNKPLEQYAGEVSRGVRGLNWEPLPATLKEAEQIKSLLADKKEFAPVVKLTGGEALEEALKQIPAPRILHLATHGFYLPDQQERSDETAAAPLPRDGQAMSAERLAALGEVENPLLRSGVVLAGANRAAAEEAQPDRGEDGWVTAEEIGMLDLTGTELVVLSACETGLGDVRTGEGVSGLRRAFLHAGARSLVTSLYKVPDDATQRLMSSMYKRLAAGSNVQAALREAQLEMIAERRKEHGGAHPFFWASFILVGSRD